jgi:hypothetical protein
VPDHYQVGWSPLPTPRDPLLDVVDLHGPHDFRHTFATWLEDAGVPARVIDAQQPMLAGRAEKIPRLSGKAVGFERTAVAATGAVSGPGRLAGCRRRRAATASPSEGRRSAVRPYNRAQAAHLILIGGCDPCAAGGTLLRQEELCQSDAVWVAGRSWPTPSAVIELSRRNDPDDRRPAPNRSRSRAPFPPVWIGWGGRRSIPWWPGWVARVNLAKATDLLDERYGLSAVAAECAKAAARRSAS